MCVFKLADHKSLKTVTFSLCSNFKIREAGSIHVEMLLFLLWFKLFMQNLDKNLISNSKSLLELSSHVNERCLERVGELACSSIEHS